MNETKVCELCRMHRKLPVGPAGALWLETDSTGEAWLMVEPVCGQTIAVRIPAWYCPACGADLRPRAKGEAENGTDA